MNKYTVLNPQGYRAPVQRTPLAPRLDSLDGKTIYIVDMRWPYTEQFTKELRDILAEKYPGTAFIRREKAGPYGEADPKLWEEIGNRGDGTIMAIGH
jgi:hypothetical protein